MSINMFDFFDKQNSCKSYFLSCRLDNLMIFDIGMNGSFRVKCIVICFMEKLDILIVQETFSAKTNVK